MFDTLVRTILDIEGKTKDIIKPRIDLKKIGIRPSLWMKPDKRKEILQFLSALFMFWVICIIVNGKLTCQLFVGGVKRDDGFLSINTNRCWYNDDPYILATMAKQISYIDDPKDGRQWKMSNLISNCRAISRDNKTPFPAGSVAATSPLDLGMTGVSLVTPVSPTVSPAPASSNSSVTHHVLNARRTHRQPQSSKEAKQSVQKKKKTKGPCRLLKMSQTTRTTTEKITITWDPRHCVATAKEQHSTLASDIGSSWKVVPPNVKKVVLYELLHHYELTNLDANQNQYINDLCISRFTQWKSDHHKHYDNYDSLEIALAVGCPKELVDRQDEWEWLCGHFQDKKYLVRGSKFPEIDMFKEVYVWPGDELTEQPHSTMVEKGQTVLEEMVSQFPPKTPIEERGLVAMLVVEEMAMANKVVVVYGGDGCDKVVIVRGGGTGSQGG
ncbi:hypothetical protein D8674_037905 [Pyrus ussuriensis x Pyrus communis]|uniref:DUF4216 domain-containing protein n=1 Tax=Pyrus ussuriensis x Pyrus communis TaxID=2448454 RepID=A0A5N5HAR1_9ROSA|nr:hypothetical protein D8674_037905 [Pyrus ussuriensis x Pyrus communis]